MDNYKWQWCSGGHRWNDYNETLQGKLNNPNTDFVFFKLGNSLRRIDKQALVQEMVNQVTIGIYSIVPGHTRLVRAIERPPTPPPSEDSPKSCSVCFGGFTNPHVASCGHTLCYDCWIGIYNSGNKRCPTCRTQFDLAHLIKNYALIG